LGFLIFVAVLVLGAAAIVTLSRLVLKRKGPIEPIVRINTLDSEGEADIQRRALTAAGIWSQPRGGRLNTSRSLFVVSRYEIWVKERDAAEACAVLGIPLP
jgi:hypothetical protein